MDPNNPYVCYLYSTYPYQNGYPTTLYYSQYMSCYVDPNNPNTCYPYVSSSPPNNQYAPNVYQTTTTENSYVTQTNYSTETIVPPPPQAVNTLSTETVTTVDTSMNTVYGVAIAALVVLLGVSIFLLLFSRSKTSNQPQPYPQSSATAYRCSNCGNDLRQADRFCGRCGAQIDRP